MDIKSFEERFAEETAMIRKFIEDLSKLQTTYEARFVDVLAELISVGNIESFKRDYTLPLPLNVILANVAARKEASAIKEEKVKDIEKSTAIAETQLKAKGQDELIAQIERAIEVSTLDYVTDFDSVLYLLSTPEPETESTESIQ